MIACTLGIAIAATSGGFLDAQQKEEYTPKVEIKKLAETDLHGVQGKRVTIMNFKLPPGYTGGKHYHTGPVFVYVANGTLEIGPQNVVRGTFLGLRVIVDNDAAHAFQGIIPAGGSKTFQAKSSIKVKPFRFNMVLALPKVDDVCSVPPEPPRPKSNDGATLLDNP